MINERGHLSSETIDLLLLSALNPSDANKAKAHLDGCSFCKTRWVELNEHKEQFDQFVFARTLPSVEKRVVAPAKTTVSWKWLVPAFATMAALLVFRLANEPAPTGETDTTYYGVKGAADPSLQIFVLRPPATSSFEIQRGTELKPGDRLRFVVNSGSKKWVLIGSKDPAGAVSVYVPYRGRHSEPIGDGKTQRVELKTTLELDTTLGKEHLVAIFSDEPVMASTLESVLENPASAPADAKVITWDFTKSAP